MAKRDPNAELQRILAKMKDMGVTIKTTPAAGREADFVNRPLGIIDAEARKLGMTYGDRESDGYETGGQA